LNKSAHKKSFIDIFPNSHVQGMCKLPRHGDNQ
jgi:hypothetical protein